MISIVLPVFNEADVLDSLLVEITTVLDDIGVVSFALVIVDDGSTDASWSVIQSWVERDRRVTGVSLSRNFGHQAAVSAGLREAKGEAVVIMDADMQDDPHAIADFLRLFGAGYDVVYAIRRHRREGLFKRTGYWLHYRLVRRLNEFEVPVDAGDFCLVSRRVVDELNALPEAIRYVRGLRAWVGFRQIGVEVSRRERGAGESKYTAGKLAGLSLDGLFGFSILPLRLSVLAGIVLMLGGAGYGAFVLLNRLVGNPPEGFPSIALLVLMLNGATLLMLGLVGEYVGRIYLEVKKRPSYIVRERMSGRG